MYHVIHNVIMLAAEIIITSSFLDIFGSLFSNGGSSFVDPMHLMMSYKQLVSERVSAGGWVSSV